jgi:hypothetical protein
VGSTTDRRAFCLAASVLIAVIGDPRPAGAEQHADLAAAVKATYLHKFTPFVTWPAGAFSGPSSPYLVCVIGDADFEELVRRSVAGQVVGGRGFVVEASISLEQASHCHVAYFGPRGFAPTAAVLEALRGRPVLTVTDAVVGTAGGIVHFVIDGGRVRFEIDAGLAQANGIEISSRVLELALRVKRAELDGAERTSS